MDDHPQLLPPAAGEASTARAAGDAQPAPGRRRRRRRRNATTVLVVLTGTGFGLARAMSSASGPAVPPTAFTQPPLPTVAITAVPGAAQPTGAGDPTARVLAEVSRAARAAAAYDGAHGRYPSSAAQAGFVPAPGVVTTFRVRCVQSAAGTTVMHVTLGLPAPQAGACS